MSIAPRQGTCPHHQAYWLLAKKAPSIEKVFLITSQKLDLAPAQYKKKLPFLYSICAASTVFLKTSSSLSRAAALSRQTAPRCRFYSTASTFAFFIVCCWFNKSMKPSASMGPSLVLCLIHRRSPTPSSINFVYRAWSSALEILQLSRETGVQTDSQKTTRWESRCALNTRRRAAPCLSSSTTPSPFTLRTSHLGCVWCLYLVSGSLILFLYIDSMSSW